MPRVLTVYYYWAGKVYLGCGKHRSPLAALKAAEKAAVAKSINPKFASIEAEDELDDVQA